MNRHRSSPQLSEADLTREAHRLRAEAFSQWMRDIAQSFRR